jgi:hypothetical protein
VQSARQGRAGALRLENIAGRVFHDPHGPLDALRARRGAEGGVLEAHYLRALSAV